MLDGNLSVRCLDWRYKRNTNVEYIQLLVYIANIHKSNEYFAFYLLPINMVNILQTLILNLKETVDALLLNKW